MISFAQEIDRPVGLINEESDPRLPGVPRDAFTDAMARAVNGVAIVTTDGALGRWGLTVSSVASVSADPPLLLVAIARKSPVVRAIRGNGSLGVSLLSAEHASLADNFAGRADDGLPFDFDLAEWSRGAAGSPLLTAATAGFAGLTPDEISEMDERALMAFSTFCQPCHGASGAGDGVTSTTGSGVCVATPGESWRSGFAMCGGSGGVFCSATGAGAAFLPVSRDQKPGDLLSPQKEMATIVTSRKTRAMTP